MLKRMLVVLVLAVSFTFLTTLPSFAQPSKGCTAGSHMELVDGYPVCVPDSDNNNPPPPPTPPPTQNEPPSELDKQILNCGLFVWDCYKKWETWKSILDD